MDSGRRVPAGDLELLVEDRIIAFLGTPRELFEAVLPAECSHRHSAMIAGDLATKWPELNPPERRALLEQLILRIDLARESVEVTIRTQAVRDMIGSAADPSTDATAGDATLVLTIPIGLKRVGKENRLLVQGGPVGNATPDPSLLRLLGQAHRFQEMVLAGDGRSMGALANEVGISRSYFTRVFRLSFLAPEIVRAILCGEHPMQLTARSLTGRSSELAGDWATQVKQLDTAQH